MVIALAFICSVETYETERGPHDPYGGLGCTPKGVVDYQGPSPHLMAIK